jgi:hypothetical protein
MMQYCKHLHRPHKTPDSRGLKTPGREDGRVQPRCLLKRQGLSAVTRNVGTPSEKMCVAKYCDSRKTVNALMEKSSFTIWNQQVILTAIKSRKMKRVVHIIRTTEIN